MTNPDEQAGAQAVINAIIPRTEYDWVGDVAFYPHRCGHCYRNFWGDKHRGVVCAVCSKQYVECDYPEVKAALARATAQLAKAMEVIEHYADPETWDCARDFVHLCSADCRRDNYVFGEGQEVAQQAKKEIEEMQ